MKPHAKGQGVFYSLIAISIIVAIIFFVYRQILGYFFTGMDTVPLIHSARIESLSDLKDIFLSPGLEEFPAAVNLQRWYRPISVLSYSLDHALWGINPAGYHLTDLILHILVSVSVFTLAKTLMTGRTAAALMSSLVFALHPLFLELVPSNSRRMDSLVVLFVLISFLLFIKYFSSRIKSPLLIVMSLLSYAVAIGSKEIAIILPYLVFVYSFLYSEKTRSSTDRNLKALNYAMPFLIITVGYMILRIYILGGIGGYTSQVEGLSSVLNDIFDLEITYLSALIYPVDIFKLGPLAAQHLPAWTGTLFSFILINLALLLISAIIVKRAWQHVKIYSNPESVSEIQFIALMLLWFILPLCIYMLALIHGRYYLYMAGVPFSIVFAHLSSTAFRQVYSDNHCKKNIFKVLIIVIYMSYLAFSGPLLQTCNAWLAASESSRSIFEQMRDYASRIPPETVVNVYNYPDRIQIDSDDIQPVLEAEMPAFYSVKAWFDLMGLSHNVVVKSRYEGLVSSCGFDDVGITVTVSRSKIADIHIDLADVREIHGAGDN